MYDTGITYWIIQEALAGNPLAIGIIVLAVVTLAGVAILTKYCANTFGEYKS